jgi:hypothetical protein
MTVIAMLQIILVLVFIYVDYNEYRRNQLIPMKKEITFNQAIDILKKDIRKGRVKITPEKISRMMDIFAPTPSLKLNKIEEVKTFKVKKPSMFKRGLIKVNLFNRIW